MNDSTFDPSTFLNQRVSGDFSRRPPIPAGSEVVGVVQPEMKIRQAQSKDGETLTFLDIPIRLDLTATPHIAKHVGADSLTLTHGIRLDFKNGAIDNSPGRNGGLRQYREALKLTAADGVKDFGITDLAGRIVKCKISHREYQGDIFDQIASVTRP